VRRSPAKSPALLITIGAALTGGITLTIVLTEVSCTTDLNLHAESVLDGMPAKASDPAVAGSQPSLKR